MICGETNWSSHLDPPIPPLDASAPTLPRPPWAPADHLGEVRQLEKLNDALQERALRIEETKLRLKASLPQRDPESQSGIARAVQPAWTSSGLSS